MKHFLALIAACGICTGQLAGPANEGYRTEQDRARVAANLDGPSRDARQKPVELVRALEIKRGSAVVDLGTGVGYMLPYLSSAVGAEGVVIAQDIQKDFIERAKEKANREKLRNVRFVLGDDRDPGLTPDSADLILVLDAYHHFDYPERMLPHLLKALRADGRLAIVEFYKRRGAMGGDPDRAIQHIRLDADDMIKEVEAGGFRLLRRQEHVPDSQYIAIFQKKQP
jgi:ubiquinone/menaquinone biosynthesis C-methylase UbiE